MESQSNPFVWSVASRTFYRQILSLLYRSFSLLKLPPPACPGTTCINYELFFYNSLDNIIFIGMPGSSEVLYSGSRSLAIRILCRWVAGCLKQIRQGKLLAVPLRYSRDAIPSCAKAIGKSGNGLDPNSLERRHPTKCYHGISLTVNGA